MKHSQATIVAIALAAAIFLVLNLLSGGAFYKGLINFAFELLGNRHLMIRRANKEPSNVRSQNAHRKLLAVSRFTDPKSIEPRIFRPVGHGEGGEDIGGRAGEEGLARKHLWRPSLQTHFHVAEWLQDAGVYVIKILYPKEDCKYSVTIVSQGKYTGVAQLQARNPRVVVYNWRPMIALDDYEVLVYELKPGYAMYANHITPTVQLDPIGFTLSVNEEQLGGKYASLLLINDLPPCNTLHGKSGALSMWDGTWIGPGLDLVNDNAIRTGWSFLPSPEMNCQIETFSTEDLLSIPSGPDGGRDKSILVIGTSVMRGVFLSIADLLLPDGDKVMFGKSVISKCWGRAQVTKGNLMVMYQDFRVGEFEKPEEVGTDFIECHNGEVVKEGSEFLKNAYRVWEEVFEDVAKWPSVIFLLSGAYWGYENFDFESHTLYFTRNIPQTWGGKLIIADGHFSGAMVQGGADDFNNYRSEIRNMLAAINDPRVRWLDGMGVSKEMKLHTEKGAEFVAGSVHFHRKCSNRESLSVKVCSNITEVVAQMLIGEALGPKDEFQELVRRSGSHLIGEKQTLIACTACQLAFFPFYLTPYPNMTCYAGPLQARTAPDQYDVGPPKACPKSCLNQEPDWSFPSQSGTVLVRKCMGIANNQNLADFKTVSSKPIKAYHVPDNTVMTSAMTSNVSRAPTLQLAPYSIENLVELSSNYFKTFGILVYDPEGDDFLLLYNYQRHKWSDTSNAKLVWSYQMLTNLLRKDFPERFRGPESSELVIAIGGGDYPYLKGICYQKFPHVSPDCTAKSAPILQFGSVYRHSEILPNMIAMPNPVQLVCLLRWRSTRVSACPQFQQSGQDSELKFEDLIPQVIWRGKDFSYLGLLNHGLRRPNPDQDIASHINPGMEEVDMKTAAVAALTQLYDILLPRWKGVVLTAEAELEAVKMKEDVSHSSLPWVNIKFSGGTTPVFPTYFSDLAKFGIDALGDYMDTTDLAKYKYQIDLGGGGGTTWTGTMQKLAMPGLLFHHLTPTEDYSHDWMQPWIHYIPVAEDLHDLREKFDWAEANPQAAKMISENGSELMRHLSTPEGLDEFYQRSFVEPARRVIEAYLPVSVTHPGLSWKDVLKSLEGDSWVTIWRCRGWGVQSCKRG